MFVYDDKKNDVCVYDKETIIIIIDGERYIKFTFFIILKNKFIKHILKFPNRKSKIDLNTNISVVFSVIKILYI